MSERARRLSRRPAVRDMDVTAFAKILGDLVARVPGAFASALVDGQGETVDYAGDGDPFDMKIAAAHIRILMSDLERLGRAEAAGATGGFGTPTSITIRGARRSLIGRRLPEGYALVVLLRRRAGFTASERAFVTCERLLAKEAGWSVPRSRWFPVEVVVGPRGRPVFVVSPGAGGPGSARVQIPVEVFGAVVGLSRRELGFRVRLATGGEVTLVREAGRAWYSDEDL